MSCSTFRTLALNIPRWDSTCVVGGPKRSSFHEVTPLLKAWEGGDQRTSRTAHEGTLPRACQALLTCPWRIWQPLDSSHNSPLEKFPNFFTGLHALAWGRPKESQKEETTKTHAPGLCVHHRCPGHPFPAVDSTLPARRALQALEEDWRPRFPVGAI